MEVGQELLYRCSKCKLTLAHMVEITYQGKILKVRCKTCKAVHSYKDPAVPKEKKVGTVKKKSSQKRVANKATREENYDRLLLEARENGVERNYKMSDSYNVGEIIDHPKFGIGLISEICPEHVTVTFKEGVKKLMHNFVEIK